MDKLDTRIWESMEYQDDLIRTYVPDAIDLGLDRVEAVCLALERDEQAAKDLEFSAEQSSLNMEAAVKAARKEPVKPSISGRPFQRSAREAQILRELGF